VNRAHNITEVDFLASTGPIYLLPAWGVQIVAGFVTRLFHIAVLRSVRCVLIFAYYCHVTRTIHCFCNYLRLNIHGVHMKCIPAYCNITQELRGTRMRPCVQVLWPAFYTCSMRRQRVV
jgi:hypothetical protein